MSRPSRDDACGSGALRYGRFRWGIAGSGHAEQHVHRTEPDRLAILEGVCLADGEDLAAELGVVQAAEVLDLEPAVSAPDPGVPARDCVVGVLVVWLVSPLRLIGGVVRRSIPRRRGRMALEAENT